MTNSSPPLKPRQSGQTTRVPNQETSIGLRGLEEASHPISPELGGRTAPTLEGLTLEVHQPREGLFGAKKPISPPTKPSVSEPQVQVRINNLLNKSTRDRPNPQPSAGPRRVFLPIDTEEAAGFNPRPDQHSGEDSEKHATLHKPEAAAQPVMHAEMPIAERRQFWSSVMGRPSNAASINKVVPQIRLIGIPGLEGTPQAGGESHTNKDSIIKKNESPRQPDSSRLKMLAGFLLSKSGAGGNPTSAEPASQLLKFKFPGFKGVMNAAKRMLQTGSRLSLAKRGANSSTESRVMCFEQ